MANLRFTVSARALTLMLFIATTARAQTGAVNIQGLGSHALPMLDHPMLVALGLTFALIAIFKLRHSTLLASVLLAGMVIGVAVNSPRLMAAIGLEIPASSPACSGGSDSFSFDPYSAPSLTNQCPSTSVRISGYELPCATVESGADVGSTLTPGVSLSLQQCVGGNRPPSFSLSTTSLTIAEDAGSQTLNNWLTNLSAGPASESAQTVSVSVSHNYPALFATAPTLAADGSLSFTAAVDAFGEAIITATATDSDGASSSQTLTLTITPVNDPPTFTLPAVLPLLEDNGLDISTDPNEPEYDEGPDGVTSTPVSVANLATDISPGNTWEAGQAVHFEISHFDGNADYYFHKGVAFFEPFLANKVESVELVQIDNDPLVQVDGVWGVQHDSGFIGLAVTQGVHSGIRFPVFMLNDRKRLLHNGDWILVNNFFDGERGIQALIDGDPSGTLPGERLNTIGFRSVHTPISHDISDYQLNPAGTFSAELLPHAFGEVELSVTAVDAGGLRSAPQRLRLDIAPVWDTRPEGRPVQESGPENSNCIQVSWPGITFRNTSRPHFILSDANLNGGQLLTNGNPMPFGSPHLASTLCYVPPDDQKSAYNTSTDTFEPFATFTYRVWSGFGDWQTGESPALDGSEHSGVFLELSEPNQVEIVVTPKF
ncbi:hypothetical protein KO507_09160 [Gilvimarinus agarilyticus]|uniref:hypothetical protein n=1 Tax=Gilvimarinus sp. 2_MG-2023 TaxID=3062666 RepID=UPI001C08320A|nr:hypothetical protein [Gilvimarinus sp. 2_MG-2023]MBU2885928.1 hypothetical protein [Gilvimarinus agarilyticus]MDO6570674.1 hypothetical protein [Gilvimarinus sp. 2_MG-2023]